MNLISKGVIAGLAGVASGAVTQELLKPSDQRAWHGTFAGIPYDFRRPTAERARQTMWNPADQRIVMPRWLGIGWDVNFGRLAREARAKIGR
jgi:hypothetical protein